jgi:hypothetical protein
MRDVPLAHYYGREPYLPDLKSSVRDYTKSELAIHLYFFLMGYSPFGDLGRARFEQFPTQFTGLCPYPPERIYLLLILCGWGKRVTDFSTVTRVSAYPIHLHSHDRHYASFATIQSLYSPIHTLSSSINELVMR